MNCRQAKKRYKKYSDLAEKLAREERHYFECNHCRNYENDPEVGLVGCDAPQLYDNNGDIMEHGRAGQIVSMYTSLGIGCPYFMGKRKKRGT